jgi:hypothetical protein
MKKNKLAAIILCISLTAYYSCKRDYTMKSPASITQGKSFLRIIDAAPNFRKIFNAPDSFNVLVNDNKITAYTPGTAINMTFGSTYPTAATNYGYVAVDPGTNIIKLTLGITNPDSIELATFSKTFLADKYYTFMITDSVSSAREQAQIFVQDNFSPVPSGYYNLRFIHAIFNDTTGKNIDIWSTRANRYIYTNIKPDSITGFSQWAYNPILNDTFYVRRTGNPAVTLDTLNAIGFGNQRTYTLYYRGDANSNFNTNAKRRHLASYVHQ